jgi:hypothetical protein
MTSLADLAELRGFFSYSREDDEDSHGGLTALRDRIQRELRSQLGRSTKSFGLWQDKEAIAPGAQWETEIKNAVAQSVFFIPIITPTVVKSQYCRFELESFLARQTALDRNDLVFPILYINVAALNDSELRQNDPVLSMIAERNMRIGVNFVTGTSIQERSRRPSSASAEVSPRRCNAPGFHRKTARDRKKQRSCSSPRPSANVKKPWPSAGKLSSARKRIGAGAKRKQSRRDRNLSPAIRKPQHMKSPKWGECKRASWSS